MEKIKDIQAAGSDEIHISGVCIGGDFSATVNFARQITLPEGDPLPQAFGPFSESGPAQITLTPEETVAVLLLPGHTEMVAALHQKRIDARDAE